MSPASGGAGRSWSCPGSCSASWKRTPPTHSATQDAGFAGYEVSNIAHLRLCRGLPMSGGFGLNVTNQVAAQFYADNGLGSVLILPETKDSDISTIAPTHAGKPVPTGVLVYGHAG